ncbi:MAG: peroxiredoxin family protein [Candidatus Methylomirabilales bacterium]
MPALEARRKEFEAAGATILGISCDSLYSHDAWARHHGLSYPLLSDIHRTVCQAYGVHNVERNCARRSVFIIDKQASSGSRRNTARANFPIRSDFSR